MSIFFASLGIIFGTIYFAMGDNRVLVAAIIALIFSSTIFTTLKAYKKQILSFLICFLVCFFNYYLRAESLEYMDLTKYIQERQSHIYFQIVNPPRNKIFNSEIIIQIKDTEKNLRSLVSGYFLAKKFIAKVPSTLGLEEGDIIEISPGYSFKKLTKEAYQINKKHKCFYEIKEAKITFKNSQENIFTKIQKSIKDYYYKTLNPENAAITSSLLLGAKIASAPERFTKISYKLGIGHFLAASGFQLVVLIFLVNFIFKNLKTPLIINNSLCIIFVLAYAALAGFSASITRAAICTIAFLLLQLVSRKLDSKRFITILAGAVLLIDPYVIFDLGFQFSYLASLAILCWTKTIENKLNFIKPSFIRETVAITFSVQFFLLPLSIYYFGNLQVWSIFANILLTPVLSLISLLAFFGLSLVIEPILNVLKYLIYNSEKLPFLDSAHEISLTTAILFTITINALGVLFFRPESKISSLQNFNNKYFISAILISSLSLLLASNLNPFNTISLNIENGLIKNYNQLNQAVNDKNINYKYFDYHGVKILLIKKRQSLKALGDLTENLHEVDVLLLPKLNNRDIYLNTLIDITKPQFIVTTIAKSITKDEHNDVSEDFRVDSNLNIITSKANTIIDSGVIYISKGKFWNLSR